MSTYKTTIFFETASAPTGDKIILELSFCGLPCPSLGSQAYPQNPVVKRLDTYESTSDCQPWANLA